MAHKNHPLLSVVIPVYNEGTSIQKLHEWLLMATRKASKDSYEIIYCDDGSTDNTAEIIAEICHKDPSTKLIQLSRNFGKESALSAGISMAKGEAIVMIDGDGQHPPELIPALVEKWRAGAQVVVGLRSGDYDEGFLKRAGSKIFYKIFNRMTGENLIPGSTDFRLIDRQVQQAFLKLTESERMTRGLIDWLGFDREFIEFKAQRRIAGQATYSPKKLLKLATNSFVSMSPVPLYLFGFLGIIITFLTLILGSAILVEQLLLNDPLSWHFTGTAMLSILLLFLVGIILMSQGILSLYISHTHTQSKRRPLYIIDNKKSIGIYITSDDE